MNFEEAFNEILNSKTFDYTLIEEGCDLYTTISLFFKLKKINWVTERLATQT